MWGEGEGEAREKRGRVSQSSDVAFFSSSLSVRFQTPLKLLTFSLEPALSLFSMCIPCYSLPRSYFAYTFSSFSISAYHVFFRVVFFFCPFFLRFLSAAYFSFALPPFQLTPSSHLASRSGWGGYRVDLRPPQGDNYL